MRLEGLEVGLRSTRGPCSEDRAEDGKARRWLRLLGTWCPPLRKPVRWLELGKLGACGAWPVGPGRQLWDFVFSLRQVGATQF